MALVPYVIENTAQGERSYDLFSRLLKDRIVMISGEVDDATMNIAVAELLFLNNESKEKPIYLYINSPGGSVVSGLQLIDTMRMIEAPVYTIAMGMAASMGCAILAAGEKGHRYAMPSSQILAHPMSGGTGRERTKDGIIAMNNERKLKDYLLGMNGHDTGHISDKAWEEIKKVLDSANIKDPNMVLVYSSKTKKELEAFDEICEYDHWMFPEEAKKLGFVDEILTSEKTL